MCKGESIFPQVFGVRSMLITHQTCCSLYSILSGSIGLQHKIELGAHHLALLRVDEEPVHKRHQHLQERIHACCLFDLHQVGLRVPSRSDFEVYSTSITNGCLRFCDHTLDVTSARIIDLSMMSPSHSLTREWTAVEIQPIYDDLAVICTLMDASQVLRIRVSSTTENPYSSLTCGRSPGISRQTTITPWLATVPYHRIDPFVQAV